MNDEFFVHLTNTGNAISQALDMIQSAQPTSTIKRDYLLRSCAMMIGDAANDLHALSNHYDELPNDEAREVCLAQVARRLDHAAFLSSQVFDDPQAQLTTNALGIARSNVQLAQVAFKEDKDDLLVMYRPKDDIAKPFNLDNFFKNIKVQGE